MGKILVLYFSESGNTREMANLVAEGAKSVKGSDVRLLSIDKAKPEELLWADGVAMGAPTYEGLLSWQAKKWWDEAVKAAWGKVFGKIGCAFSSSGGWGGGAELTCQSIMTIMINFGFMVFGVPDYTGPQMTLHYGSIAAGKPANEPQRESCRRLGKRLSELVDLRRGNAGK